MRGIILLLLFLLGYFRCCLGAIKLNFDKATENDAIEKTILVDSLDRPMFVDGDVSMDSTSSALEGIWGPLGITLKANLLESWTEPRSDCPLSANATLASNMQGIGVSSFSGSDFNAVGTAIVLSFDTSELVFSNPSVSLVFRIHGDQDYLVYKQTDGKKCMRMFPESSSSGNFVIADLYSNFQRTDFVVMMVKGSLHIKSLTFDAESSVPQVKGENISPLRALQQVSLNANSEITLDFNRVGDAVSKKVFRFTNPGSTSPTVEDVSATKSCFTLSSASEKLSGVTGSLVVTWQGKDASRKSADASTWTFGADAIIHSNLDGLGVVSTGETGAARQLGDGEAFVVSFDTSNLSLPPGAQLVFTVQAGAGDTYRIYRRTKADTGKEVFSMSSSLQAIPSDLIPVASGYQPSRDVYQFAIVDAGWNGGTFVRVNRFSVGIIKAAAATAYTPPQFFTLFTNNMMLQRSSNVAVYGTATSGISVTVTFGNIQTKTAVTDNQGSWYVELDPLTASYSPRTLSVSDGVNTATISNVLVGDIWLCSGQSNMDRTFRTYKSLNTANKDNAFIRLVQLQRVWKDAPSETLTLEKALDYSWQQCSSYYLTNTSPVEYYFAAKMESQLNVPIGIIHAAMGGTSIEPWLPPEAIGTVPDGVLGETFNGMIYPLRRFTFKGVLWYQGESNAQWPVEYRSRFPAMIKAWRDLFGRGAIPFYFAELASCGPRTWDITDTAWAFLQEAQRMALTVLNTKMIVLTDVGEYINLHPENKQAVGERFARLALQDEGVPGINTDSPTFRDMQISGSKVLITFNYVGGGLETRLVKMNYNRGLAQGTDPDAFVVPANQLWGFSVAGPDEVFVAANATITASNQVTVSSVYVPNPVAVRYCFEWFGLCNLYASNDGLVATPFRTDNFSVPESFRGDVSGVLFDRDFITLGEPMVVSMTFGPSSISPVTINGVRGYRVNATTATRLIYFANNSTKFQNVPKPYVLVTILYYDQGASNGTINFRYDDSGGQLLTGPIQIQIRNTRTWRVARAVLTDARFSKQLYGYDLRVQSESSNMIVGGVYLSGPS